MAEDNGQIAGYIGSQSVLDGADVMNLAVSPSYRRQGIGQALIKELVEHLRQRGIIALLLEVRVSNTPAIALYEKLGFIRTAELSRWYDVTKVL